MMWIFYKAAIGSVVWIVVPPGAARTLVQYAERSLRNPEGVPSDLPLRCVLRSSLALTLLSCTPGGRGGVGRAQRGPQQEPLVISHKCNPPPWDLCAVRLALLALTPGPWIVIVCIEFDWKGICVTRIPSFCLISLPYILFCINSKLCCCGGYSMIFTIVTLDSMFSHSSVNFGQFFNDTEFCCFCMFIFFYGERQQTISTMVPFTYSWSWNFFWPLTSGMPPMECHFHRADLINFSAPYLIVPCSTRVFLIGDSWPWIHVLILFIVK